MRLPRKQWTPDRYGYWHYISPIHAREIYSFRSQDDALLLLFILLQKEPSFQEKYRKLGVKQAIVGGQ